MLRLQNKIINSLRLSFAYLMYIVSHFIPRNKNLWVCIGWHKNECREVFADNAKYFFLSANTKNDLRVVWIAHDRSFASILQEHGFDAYYQGSICGIWSMLRAGVTVVDALLKRVNWQYTGNTTLVQLWHGKGFKKVVYASKESIGKFSKLKNPHLFAKFDYAVASSEYTARMMGEVLHMSRDQVFVTGLPRNDVLFHKINGADIDAHPELLELFKNSNNATRYILYAPTFRRYKQDPLGPIDLEIVNAYLAQHALQMVVSLHPKYARYSEQQSRQYSNIIFIKAGYDIYPYLSKFETLITDYSSLFLEFVLLDKHCIFFTHDIQKYRETTGLYDDFEKLTPGPHVSSTQSLLSELETKKAWSKKRIEVRNHFYKYIDGNSSTRIINHLKEVG